VGSNIPLVPFALLNAGADPGRAGLNTSGLNPSSSLFVRAPTYRTFSNFDFQSLNLVKHQEDIELDLFNYAIALWEGTPAFADAGISEEDQEISHSYLVGNMIGQDLAPEPCKYAYPFCTEPTRECVRQFLQFSQVLTRWGESGVYGFLPLLDNGAVGELLLNSIVTEARQQYSFRQLLGLFPVPEHFIPGIPQSWSWTLLSQHITACPQKNHQHPVQWSIWPPLHALDPPAVAARPDLRPAVSSNVSALAAPGDVVRLRWDPPGELVGPYAQPALLGSKVQPGDPLKLMFVSQLNVTYVEPLSLDWAARRVDAVVPPFIDIFPPEVVIENVNNGTLFVALVARDTPYLTPANLSIVVLDGWMAAGPMVLTVG
ncbi:hypothetical protein HK405_010663, partial [Cladochytrium tenue]